MSNQKNETHPLQNYFKDFLGAELDRRKQKNPRYSLRAFARFLDCDFSTLAKILKGERKMGQRVIKKLSAHFNITDEQLEIFLKEHKKKPREK